MRKPMLACGTMYHAAPARARGAERDSDGALRHLNSGHRCLADGMKERIIDELNPIWNVMDLAPQGRGKWYASLDYGTKAQAARR
jgi:predicted dithiol-disulfide oxidoreductase (DUF899 family)